MMEQEKDLVWCLEVFMSEREREIFSQVAELAEQYQAEKVVLFGSRARRTHHEKSDIDLAVYGCKNFNNFYFDMQEKVQTLLNFDVIDMEQGVSEELRQEIERDGVVIYEKI